MFEISFSERGTLKQWGAQPKCKKLSQPLHRLRRAFAGVEIVFLFVTLRSTAWTQTSAWYPVGFGVQPRPFPFGEPFSVCFSSGPSDDGSGPATQFAGDCSNLAISKNVWRFLCLEETKGCL